MQRNTSNHGPQFMPALDSRNRRVPGLCTRNGRYYAQLWLDLGSGRKSARRLPLIDENKQPIRSLAEAKDALISLREKRKQNTLPQRGRRPTFAAFAAQYLQMASTRQKRKRTQGKEEAAIQMWNAHFGQVRLDQISTPMIKDFVERRLNGCRLRGKYYEPAAPRTVALDLIALRNVLKAAIDSDHIRELPRFPRVKVPPPPRRRLLTPEQFRNVLECCFVKKDDGEPLTKNGQQLHDFLHLLAFSGAREQEALRLRWSHVDFARRRIFIGADENFKAAAMHIGSGGISKTHTSRIVDFNPQLEGLLRKMHERRAPDSDWLFPSPQRGQKDIHAKTFRESFNLVRTKAELPNIGFHDLRHLFCSFSVMAGIDFMTIASWLGHKDGGILIGKVYGHLLDDHRQKMAAKLTIALGPTALVHPNAVKVAFQAHQPRTSKDYPSFEASGC
jgi:integrase